VRNDGRWKLTDAQRFAVVLAVVFALFLSAMSWGMQSLGLFLVAVVLLVAAGLGVFMLGLRHTSTLPIRTNAHVITVSPPPTGKIVGRCDLQLLVELEGRPSPMVKFRDPSAPVIKWPRPGTVLPVEVARRNVRQLRIRWETVKPHHARATTPAEEEAAFTVPFFTDYADGAPGAVYRSESSEPADPATAPPPATATVLDEHFPPAPGTEADPETVRILAGLVLDGEIVDDQRPPNAAAGTVGEPEPGSASDPAPDPAPASASKPPPEPQSDPGPIRTHDPVTETYELPVRTIPQPRAASSTENSDTPGMGIMLIVSDLARSLRFYQEMLDFTLVDTNSGSAVLAYRGGRILLRRVVDMSPVDRRVVHLHIQVPDVDGAYKELKRKGIEFVHRPRVANRGDRLELWAATFRDPDGHAIALTQWRERA